MEMCKRTTDPTIPPRSQWLLGRQGDRANFRRKTGRSRKRQAVEAELLGRTPKNINLCVFWLVYEVLLVPQVVTLILYCHGKLVQSVF